MQTYHRDRASRIDFRVRIVTAVVCGCAAVLFAPGGGSGVKPTPAAKPDENVTASSLKETSPSRELTVAAASDLKFTLDEILAAFEKVQPEVRVKVTCSSSGNFFA